MGNKYYFIKSVVKKLDNDLLFIINYYILLVFFPNYSMEILLLCSTV